MRIVNKLGFVLLSVGALAACSAPQVVQESSGQQYIEGLYGYGAADRDLQIAVSGNPFTAPQTALDLGVEQGLSHGSILQPPTRPRLRPDASARPGYALVLAFQPALDVSGQDVCEAPLGNVAPSPAVRVEAAFCVSGRAYSYATGRVNAQGPDDPAFQDLMRQLMVSLFRRDEMPMTSGGEPSR